MPSSHIHTKILLIIHRAHNSSVDDEKDSGVDVAAGHTVGKGHVDNVVGVKYVPDVVLQRFLASDVLGLLELPQPHYIAVLWCYIWSLCIRMNALVQPEDSYVVWPVVQYSDRRGCVHQVVVLHLGIS